MFKVPYTTILDVQKHPNADLLDIITIYGFQIISQKNKYKIGDKIIFIPIDSILPIELEEKITKNSKIKINKHRVRQIKIRSLASQGMIIDPSVVSDIINLENFALETDLSAILNITKYEPPEQQINTNVPNPNKVRKVDNPNFHKYNGIDNIKWFPTLFKKGEEVSIQEKIHGSNCRFGILPYAKTTLLRKILSFFKLAPKFEKCYGSNNVEISARLRYTGYYGEDVYGKAIKQIKGFDKLKPGEVCYGEIFGPGIQKGYSYGLKEPKFILFDVKVLQEDGKLKWLNPEEVEQFAKERGFEFVPVLYTGPFNKAYTETLVKGPSVYCPDEKVREGIVIKSRYNFDNNGDKKCLKWISEEYLADFTNTDNH